MILKAFHKPAKISCLSGVAYPICNWGNLYKPHLKTHQLVLSSSMPILNTLIHLKCWVISGEFPLRTMTYPDIPCLAPIPWFASKQR